MDPDVIIRDVTAVTKQWTKQRRRERREASARANRRAAMVRAARVSVKAAVFEVMGDAIAATSGGGRVVFPRRNLFYSVRRLIQRHTPEQLTRTNFEKVLREWEEGHGQVEGMYCDPRGYFIEPHTGRKVPLGTREVESYQIPAWRYDKILFVEKKGFHGLFQQARLAERYDVGIMCAEGYSSEAGKLLLARAEEGQEMTILCLHDADPFGYNIARKLAHATRAGRRVNVIDFGMTVEEAQALGLAPEDFYRDRALPAGLELTGLAREWFEGRPTGTYRHDRPVYRCRRVELNDLASDPDRFVSWVEAKLREHGCAGKLVPPRGVVLGRAKDLRADLLGAAAREALSSLLDLDGLAADLAGTLLGNVPVKDLPRALAAWAGEAKPEAWDAALGRLLGERVGGLRDALRERALARLKDIAGQLGAGR